MKTVFIVTVLASVACGALLPQDSTTNAEEKIPQLLNLFGQNQEASNGGGVAVENGYLGFGHFQAIATQKVPTPTTTARSTTSGWVSGLASGKKRDVVVNDRSPQLFNLFGQNQEASNGGGVAVEDGYLGFGHFKAIATKKVPTTTAATTSAWASGSKREEVIDDRSPQLFNLFGQNQEASNGGGVAVEDGYLGFGHFQAIATKKVPAMTMTTARAWASGSKRDEVINNRSPQLFNLIGQNQEASNGGGVAVEDGYLGFGNFQAIATKKVPRKTTTTARTWASGSKRDEVVNDRSPQLFNLFGQHQEASNGGGLEIEDGYLGFGNYEKPSASKPVSGKKPSGSPSGRKRDVEDTAETDNGKAPFAQILPSFNEVADDRSPQLFNLFGQNQEASNGEGLEIEDGYVGFGNYEKPSVSKSV